MFKSFSVGRPRLNRTNEIPSGNLTPERPKPTQALLKQSNESIKMAVQNIVPVNEVPTLANEVVTVTTSEPAPVVVPIAVPDAVPTAPNNIVPLNVSNIQEVTTNENEKKSIVKSEVPVSQSNILLTPSVTTTTTPPKIIQPTTQFVQVKPPTTTSGRVQSPNVKNFFIRKGIEKQSSSQIVNSPTTTFITTSGTTQTPQISQLPANKKIIIKSQQIIVPATNMKQNPGQIIKVSGQQNITGSPVPISVNANIIDSSAAADLSGILDLPILFADNANESAVIDQTQILTTTVASNILLNTSVDRNAQIGSPTNIFFTAADGKLPNRPVVISAAKIGKPTQQPTIVTTSTPTNSKVIFINRNQIRPQGVPGTQLVKGLPTLKLVPTSLATSTQSTPITLQGNQITKLSPGTKIDLSSLKLVKNASPNVSGNIMKPLIINKAGPGAKNAIVIKSPITGNVQTHPAVIKANVLNRNITVKKVMNMVPGVKAIVSSPIAVSSANLVSPIQSTAITSMNLSTVSVSNTSPVTVASPPKTTRKTRNSN